MILDYLGRPFPSRPTYYEKKLLHKVSPYFVMKHLAGELKQESIFDSFIPILFDHRGRPLPRSGLKGKSTTIKWRRYSDDKK